MLSQNAHSRKMGKKVQCSILTSIVEGHSCRGNYIFKHLEHVIRESMFRKWKTVHGGLNAGFGGWRSKGEVRTNGRR